MAHISSMDHNLQQRRLLAWYVVAKIGICGISMPQSPHWTPSHLCLHGLLNPGPLCADGSCLRSGSGPKPGAASRENGWDLLKALTLLYQGTRHVSHIWVGDDSLEFQVMGRTSRSNRAGRKRPLKSQGKPFPLEEFSLPGVARGAAGSS